MRLLVTEFITGGGMANDPLPTSLKQEGQLMLQAILHDCSRMQDVHVVTTRDARISPAVEAVEISIIERDYLQQLTQIAKRCDASWVIAPESEGILEKVVAHLTNENITLINSDVHSIHIASDKLLCEKLLQQHNILTPCSLTQQQTAGCQQALVIKHRHGAGCEGLMHCENGAQALRNIDDSSIDDFSRWIVQPYLEGKHLSISMIFSVRGVRVVSLNEQLFVGDRQPQLSACRVNAYPVNAAIENLAEQLFKALPGLKGYVGVDVIEQRGQYIVLDINPRLTSSYIGLHDVLEENPATLCLHSVLNARLPEVITINDQTVEVCVA